MFYLKFFFITVINSLFPFLSRAAWDFALDMCLRQLPTVAVVDSDGTMFDHSTFFAQQLTAFQVWLTYGSEIRSPPEQLPIVLQVSIY